LQLSFPNRTIPVPEQAKNGGSRFQALNLSTLPKQQRRNVPAVYIRQASSMVVVASEENRGIAIGLCVLVKMAIDRRQNSGKIAGSAFSPVVKAALEVGHQQRGCHAFPGNVGQNKTHATGPHVEKVIVVSPHGARLNAFAGIVERLQRRLVSREEPALNIVSDDDVLHERLVTRPRREIEIPYVGLGTQTFEADIALSWRTRGADPHHAKDGLARSVADVEEFSEFHEVAGVGETRPATRYIHRRGFPADIWTGQRRNADGESDLDPFLA
jgi:hypothetical protein